MQVIFAVNDLARSLDFYAQTFGWPRNERIDYDDYVELIPPDGGSLGRFADAAATAARTESAGGRPLAPLAPSLVCEEAAGSADPDGNVVAVAQPALVQGSSR